MKSTFFKYTIIFVSLFSMFFATSCELDDDEPNGLEDARTKFNGSWMCTEQSQLSYPVTITNNPQNSSEVYINNFNLFGKDEYVVAKIAGFSMSIPDQKACSTYDVSGNGQMSSNKKDIVLQYTVKDGANTETINANYTKQ